jgi:hypothetical protein
LQATSSGGLSKQEILKEVQRLGYKFSTKDPMNSLGVILYGKNPRFRNQEGRFSPMSGTASASPKANGGTPGRRSKRGQMSAEARERIAAAQRARWAKARSGK